MSAPTDAKKVEDAEPKSGEAKPEAVESDKSTEADKTSTTVEAK